MNTGHGARSCAARTLTVAVAALLLAGCGGDGTDGPDDGDAMNAASSMSATPSASGDFIAADVAFAQQMIPHHQQAVDMARLATTRAASEDVRTLAATIDGEQSAEITEMDDLLARWGQEVPTAMPGMQMGSDAMPGMQSDASMTELAALTGAAFDAMFLAMMIDHHQGALTMANAELANGMNADATAFATAIVEGQTAEIQQMQALLAN